MEKNDGYMIFAKSFLISALGRKNDHPRIAKSLVVRILFSCTLKFSKVESYWKP